MKNERNYGIDLLRIVLMYMVCILHIRWAVEVSWLPARRERRLTRFSGFWRFCRIAQSMLLH